MKSPNDNQPVTPTSSVQTPETTRAKKKKRLTLLPSVALTGGALVCRTHQRRHHYFIASESPVKRRGIGSRGKSCSESCTGSAASGLRFRLRVAYSPIYLFHHTYSPIPYFTYSITPPIQLFPIHPTLEIMSYDDNNTSAPQHHNPCYIYASYTPHAQSHPSSSFDTYSAIRTHHKPAPRQSCCHVLQGPAR